jgi:phosphatidylglycerophosphate synthase
VSFGYSTVGWGEFFLCAGGATAALSGLIFVALSINIEKVREIDQREGQSFLTGRALEALVDLLLVLGISVVALTPGIEHGVLAVVILLAAAASAVSPIRALSASRGQSPLGTAMLIRVETAIALTIILVIAGVTLAAHHGGGLYWIPAAFILAIMVAAVNAWVLLVEVVR